LGVVEISQSVMKKSRIIWAIIRELGTVKKLVQI
jgi:hypothetical protein